MTQKTLTYSHTLRVPLTRSCAAECAYCTFRHDDPHLLTFDEIEGLIRKTIDTGLCEVLLTSGQSLDSLDRVRSQWIERGYPTFFQYVRDICQLVLENQLIPTLDVGPLTMTELEMLAPYIPSYYLLLENINTDFCRTQQKGKSIDEKMEALSDAGLLHIPTTTGVLLGAGEDIDDNIDTLDAIAEIHGRHGHIQNVVLQHVAGTTQDIRMETVERLIAYSRQVMPGVHVTLPVHAPSVWFDALSLQLDDIGHIFEGQDGIRWNQPPEKLAEIQRTMQRRHCLLKPRFPVFPDQFAFRSTGETLRSVVQSWLNKKDYSYYLD